MDIAVKMTLVASIVMVGYNLHQLLTSYDAICEKVKEFKLLAQQNDSDEGAVRRSNFLLTGILSLLFVVLIYLSDLAYWIVAIVSVKMAVSILLSHFEIAQIFREDAIRPGFFKLTKVDAAVNVLIGLGIAVIAVS